ncbi:MAG: hypothetical protein ACP5H3_01440 [Candidatus Aenigmatarchaeota archaeon]
MSWIEKLKNLLFGRKSNERFIDSSDSNRSESIAIDRLIDSNQSINQSEVPPQTKLEHVSQIQEKHVSQTTDLQSTEDKKTISIEKESLQLGVAAGFVSRSLLNIEDSLDRIEHLMPSKEWITMNLTTKIEQIQSILQALQELLSKHETNEEKRFEVIIEAINRLKTTASSLPEPQRSEILSSVETIKKAAMPSKMQKIIEILKERKEISYAELASLLNITQDGLRGLLSRMAKEYGYIERFEKDNKGWVRLKSDSSA